MGIGSVKRDVIAANRAAKPNCVTESSIGSCFWVKIAAATICAVKPTPPNREKPSPMLMEKSALSERSPIPIKQRNAAEIL